MKELKAEVFLEDRHVGTLAETGDHRTAFAYTKDWIRDGFPISPFSLPLEQKVFVPVKPAFRGMWGVFADSLPDAWGRLLMDRMLSNRGIRPEDVSETERLLMIGDTGMGALSYRPAWKSRFEMLPDDLDSLCEECAAILKHEEVADPDRLFALGGSSGGARPKVMTEEWIIKFPASRETANSGRMEKAYMDCAADCGITVPETKLLPSRVCGGFFTIRRFDRQIENGKLIRKHMLTAAALLEADWRTGTTDYLDLMKLTTVLSRSNREDLTEMYRRMCFNVFAHNRDDHLKNFSWICDPVHDCWRLAPAYDLTWSTTWYGEHTLSVYGNSRDPMMKELIAVGTAAGLNRQTCSRIAAEIREKAQPLEEAYRNVKS